MQRDAQKPGTAASSQNRELYSVDGAACSPAAESEREVLLTASR